jgi:hypothetical protein
MAGRCSRDWPRCSEHVESLPHDAVRHVSVTPGRVVEAHQDPPVQARPAHYAPVLQFFKTVLDVALFSPA